MKVGVFLLIFGSLVALAQSAPVSQPSSVPPAATSRANGSLIVPGSNAAPNAASLTKEQKDELRKYDFAGAIQKLRGQTPVATGQPTESAAVSGTGLQHPSVPKKWQPPHADLGATAVSASAISTNWMEAYNLPLPGKDGRVLYSYGSGMPVLVCAPLRVCVIELQAGEHINGQAHLGDAVRWEVSPVVEGTGLEAKPLIVAKPVQAGLDTDLVVPTDRRTYVIRLVSDSSGYVPRLAFTYPQDEQAKWAAFQTRQDAERREAEAQKAAAETKDKNAGVVPMSADAINQIYFDYKISGDKQLLPERVLDDGQHTYIVLKNDKQFRELPTLMIESKGQSELVNFRVDGNRYIVDRLFNKAMLLVGVGKHQQKVTIVRDAPF